MQASRCNMGLEVLWAAAATLSKVFDPACCLNDTLNTVRLRHVKTVEGEVFIPAFFWHVLFVRLPCNGLQAL